MIIYKEPDFEGQCEGGFYIRADPEKIKTWKDVLKDKNLLSFLMKLAANGLEPVAIKNDGSWTMEVFITR